MKKYFTILLILSIVFLSEITAQVQPVKEVRAIWVATLPGMDWPQTTYNTSIQKNEIVNIIQAMYLANFNTLVLQVRSRGDLIYPSLIEPWAKSLTGTVGNDPHWNPLQFAIEECHKRQIEIHAWWNVYRVASSNIIPEQYSGPKHVSSAHPEWVKPSAEGYYLDPGIPEVKSYLKNLAIEMIKNYDIDAIHFDYIRYPQKTSSYDFDDVETYSKYGNSINKNDWRRENINKFVRELYDSIQIIKPGLKVGSAPWGNYKAGAIGVPGPAGYSYTDCFQDSRKWMAEQKHDYLVPQIYWTLDSKTVPYAPILIDWLKNSFSRHIYGGVAAYKPEVYPQIPGIIDTTRSLGSLGNVYFRYYVDINKNNFAIVKSRYSNPANIPSMPWKDSIPPNTPKNLRIENTFTNAYKLSWDKPYTAIDGDTAKYYNIYRSSLPNFSFKDGRNLLYITTTSETSYTDLYQTEPNQNYYYAISSLDKGNVESEPSNIFTLNISSISKNEPNIFSLNQNYPNPFNSTTIISYSIPEYGKVTIKLFDLMGREVKTLLNDSKEAGRFNLEFNASDYSSGLYFYKLIFIGSANQIFSNSKKMLLIR